MAGTVAPHEVRTLAHERRAARLARDWATADRLKAEIESAGWRVVDRGPDFALEPAYPPDREIDGLIRYGAPERVPTLLDDASLPGVTLVFLGAAADGAAAETGASASRRVRVMAGDAVASSHPVAGTELVTLVDAATIGALAEAGLRRVATEWLIIVPEIGDATAATVSPLLAALDAGIPDDIAAIGSIGAHTGDLHTFDPVVAGDADVLLAAPLAARRADLMALLPFDRRIVSPDRFAQWLSLALRRDAESAGDPEDVPLRAPRRALVVTGAAPADRDRRAAEASNDQLAKRDFYRLLDRFGLDPSLLSVDR